jgi:L-lactate utilization protein LutC
MTSSPATEADALARSTDPFPTRAAPDPRYRRPATPDAVARTVAALEAHGIAAQVAANGAESRSAVLALLPAGASVLDATSRTLESLGIPEAIRAAGTATLVRPQLMEHMKANRTAEARRAGAAPDVVIGSVHAVTETGQVVVASATGSQLGPYAYGAGTVIWVVGTQKIVPTLEDAYQRILDYAYPLEDERAHAAYGRGTMLGKLLIVNRERPGRIHVIFVPEVVGF